jgi:predicted amidohydrolase YtcJ
MNSESLKDTIYRFRDKLGPDLVLKDGTIVCMDPANTTAQAVAVKNEKIIAIGDNEAIQSLAGRNTHVIDLVGKTVFPGFIDSHVHLCTYASFLPKVDLLGCNNVDEVLGLLRERIRHTGPRKWVEAYRLSYDLLDGGLDRWKIDFVSPENPVILYGLGHLGCINSYALNLLNITEDTPDPFGGVIDRSPKGEPTGILREKAYKEIWQKVPPLPSKEYRQTLGTAMKHFLEAGITTVHDALASPETISMLQTLYDEEKLRLRVSVSPDIARYGDHYLNSGIHTGFGNEKLRFHQMKILLNTLGAATAPLFEDYDNDPGNRGYFLHPPEQVEEWVLNSVQRGWSVHTHVMGDREMDMVLTAYEKALAWYKEETGKDNEELRLTIAHYGLYNQALLERTAGSKIVVNTQPIFKSAKGRPGGIYEQRLGHERWLRSMPIRTLFDRGIDPCFGSDVPTAESFDVRAGLYACVEGCGQPWEAIAPYQAIRGYTINGAYALFREHDIGSIEIGKLGDFVVLSENPLTLSKERIWDISSNSPADLLIEYTIVGGRVEYSRE